MAETGALWEGEGPPALKRRKVRKGTQSCWECKRRKVRCTFVAPTESICDGCKSRQVKCISQEFHYEAAAANTRKDRLDRVEALVEQLAERADTDTPGLQLSAPQHDRSETSNGRVDSNAFAAFAPPDTSIPGLIQRESKYDGLCDTLLAAWPSQYDLDLITSVPIGTSVLFHGIVCMPYSTLMEKGMPSPKQMLQPPPLCSHPALIARKLLMLGSFLQGIPPGRVKDLGRLGTKYSQVMSHMVETASRLVTSNDELVDSLEGIECIMIESMYHNNAGNLRGAWITNRRAMTIAQMMGLHMRGWPLKKILDIKTRDRIEPGHMWLRLVMSDRYLSLMLGLPQGSPENPFAVPIVLKGCSSLERLERVDTVVGGLIIQRNKEDLHNLESTCEIEKLLQDAAASMPAQWWLAPDVASIAGSSANAFSETLRIMSQFTHYHLLAQLHLPYMLQPSTDRKYDYNKITAVSASREILSRFLLFRGVDTIASYCRGIDFLAFIACTTVCLAHIDSRQQYRTGMSDCATVFHVLAHQRLSDRGLMERTLLSMEKMAGVSKDEICRRIASILQRLLTVEEAATANDYSFKAHMSPELGEQQLSCGGNAKDSDGELSIQIPYFGTIKIKHSGVLIYEELEHLSPHEGARLNWSSKASHSTISAQHFFEPSSPASGEQQVPQADASSSITGSAEESQSGTVDKEFSHMGENQLDERYMLTPGLANDMCEDDWALQGVDMALFNSFIRGSESPAITG